MRQISLRWELPLLVLILMIVWSALFHGTYSNPFFWDDLHVIRPYSLSELLSTFHGPDDPDGIETKAFRPIAAVIFALQGSLFGENMILQRVFMAALMGGLLWSVGLLLRETGLSFRHIVVVLVLFLSSRVFTSLILWITCGSLILAYIFILLTALFYLRWVRRGSGYLLAVTLVFAALAVFTREEAYTLPMALPLLWWLSSTDRSDYRRPFAVALGIMAIVAIQYVMRSVFVPGAPQPHLQGEGFWLEAWAAGKHGGLGGLWLVIQSAWMPGGLAYVGRDQWFVLFWVAFLLFLAAIFIRVTDSRSLTAAFGVCVLGIILASPALAMARSFGVALPSLAFFTAIAIAVVDIQRGFALGRYGQGLWRPAIIGACLIGIGIGMTAGLRRSAYVAESLKENSAVSVLQDAIIVFEMNHKPLTIPAVRREAVLARLNALGIRSPEDVIRLGARVYLYGLGIRTPENAIVLDDQVLSAWSGQDKLTPPIFIEKYNYGSF